MSIFYDVLAVSRCGFPARYLTKKPGGGWRLSVFSVEMMKKKFVSIFAEFFLTIVEISVSDSS